MKKENTVNIPLTDMNFQKEVLESQLPVLVEFGADWCGTCHILAPMLAELMAEYEGKFAVDRVDVDQNKVITKQYGIRELPTVLFLKEGQVVGHIIGAVPKSVLSEKLLGVGRRGRPMIFESSSVYGPTFMKGICRI